MDEHVKNQHYVPQFLLKNFSSRDGKFIWAYDKEEKYGSKNQERPIRRVASEQFFYDKIRNSKDDSLEYVLQEIENQTAPIIANILESKTIKSLSEEDRKKLSFFVMVQHLRTIGHLRKLGDLMNELCEQLLQKANIEIEKIDTKELWFTFIEDSKLYSESIMNKVWMLVESNESFYISDNPVVLQNSSNRSEIVGTLGLESFGIEIYLPLSHSLTLCMFCEKLFESSGCNLKCIDNLICPPESIENLNFLQVESSQRFVFSHKNDVDFIEDKLNFIRNR